MCPRAGGSTSIKRGRSGVRGDESWAVIFPRQIRHFYKVTRVCEGISVTRENKIQSNPTHPHWKQPCSKLAFLVIVSWKVFSLVHNNLRILASGQFVGNIQPEKLLDYLFFVASCYLSGCNFSFSSSLSFAPSTALHLWPWVT